ncbi:phosphomannomutase/phosphoglucomutase [Bacterioplanoides sp.]|uniref:phosphomannomutase/phosphoglucomutase n=1 Tax=Bacterioplanoides sp. TaxID=2066072 RepID=UPI003B00822C
MTADVRRPKGTIVMYSRITIWLALLFISGGLAFQSLQVNLFTQSEVDQAFAKAMAGQMAHSLKIQLHDTQQLQLTASRYPRTLAALQSGGDPAWKATLKQFIPGATQVHLLKREEAMGLQSSMGFAVQQVVTRTLRGNKMNLEAVMRNQEQRFFWASAIKDPSGKIAGVLLIEYGVDWLKQFQSSTTSLLGEVVVNQHIDNDHSKGFEIFRLGKSSTQTGTAVTESINDFWYLTYIPANERPQLELLPLASSWMIVLVLTLAGLFIIVFLQKKAVQQNQLKLLTYVRTLSRTGENQFPQFSLRIFHDLAQHMEHLLKTARPISAPEEVQASAREKQDISLEQPKIKAESKRNVSSDGYPSNGPAIPGMEVEEVSDSHEQKPEISRAIFRAYDIRGIVGQDLTSDVVYWIGRALGSEVQKRGFNKISIAWDGRPSSPELAEALQRGINQSGCHSIILGAQPTGLLYYATHELDTPCGVVITGSHNPSEFNGLKIVIDRQTLTQDELMVLYHRIARNDLASGEGSNESRNLEQDYLERIEGDVQINRDLKVVIDAGNGIAGPAAKQLMEMLNIDYTALYCEVDGNFPNHHPDPSQPHNLADLQKAVIEQQADLGLAFDGDGDRVALIDNQGKIIWPDRLLMLLIEDILPRNPGRDVIYDVKSSRHLAPLISRHGGRPTMWKTGHSLMKKRMKDSNAIVGGEFSGHFYIQDRWYGFDDGLYTAARLLELISFRNTSAAEQFAALPEDLSTPEITIATTDTRKFEILKTLSTDQQLTDGARVFTTDGLRIEFSDGWGLVRPSNTTPKLTLRFAGNDQQAITRIQQRMKQALTLHAPELQVPF